MIGQTQLGGHADCLGDGSPKKELLDLFAVHRYLMTDGQSFVKGTLTLETLARLSACANAPKGSF